MKYPMFLFRKDDGIRFTRQYNGKYTMDKSEMNPKYEYTYQRLINDGFVNCLDKCEIAEYKTKNNGHGEID